MSNLWKKASLDLTALLAKDVLPKIPVIATSSVIDIFWKTKKEGKKPWDQEKYWLYSFQLKIWMILLKSWSHKKIQVYWWC